MAVAPRWNKKATKIAFNIIGTPANLRFKPSERDLKITKMLLFQQSVRSR